MAADSKPGVLNTWVADLLGVEQPFLRGHLRLSGISDVYIIIQNSGYEVSNKNNFMDGVTASWGTVLEVTAWGRLRTTALDCLFAGQENCFMGVDEEDRQAERQLSQL